MHRACDHTQRPSQAQHEIQARQCSLAASNLTSTDDHHNYDHTRPFLARAVCVIVAHYYLNNLEYVRSASGRSGLGTCLRVCIVCLRVPTNVERPYYYGGDGRSVKPNRSVGGYRLYVTRSLQYWLPYVVMSWTTRILSPIIHTRILITNIF